MKAREETLEVLADRELCESIRRGLRDFEEGRVVSHEDVKKRLLS